MSINQDTSLDMTTANEPVSATQFVESPDVQEYGSQYNPKQIVFAPGDAPNEDDVDISNVDDINDFSLSDIGNKVKELGQNALQYLGLADKPKPPEPKLEQKPTQEIPAEKEESLESMLKPTNTVSQSNQRIKDIQTYFKNPDTNLKKVLGSYSYNGPIDGQINNELKTLAAQIEATIHKLLNTQNVYGVVLRTDARDIKEAVAKLALYKDYLDSTSAKKMSLDQRFQALSKLIK